MQAQSKTLLSKFYPLTGRFVEILWATISDIKAAATDTRYFTRSKLSRSLVHKKNFNLMWQVVLKLGYLFCQER